MSDKPTIRICVTGAAGMIAYALIPQIAAGQCFGADQPVAINMLDIEFSKQALAGFAMELEDMVFPLVTDVVATVDPEVGFKDCDYCILCGAFPRKAGMERQELLAKNAAIFNAQGAVIAKVAKPNCKILVVGNPANTNAMLLQKSGNLPKENVTAMTRLDHDRATNMLARKIGGGVKGTDIQGFCIWGNHSPSMYPDVRHATLNGKPLREVVGDDTFLETTFCTDVGERGATVIKARGSSSATSAARAALEHVRDWHCGAPGIQSMGIFSDGNKYGIPEGIVYSMPVKCVGGGKYEVVEGLEIDEFSRKKMDATAAELTAEQQMAAAV